MRAVQINPHDVFEAGRSTLVVFEPPLLFWSAHLSKQSVERATYAIEISRDHAADPRAPGDERSARRR